MNRLFFVLELFFYCFSITNLKYRFNRFKFTSLLTFYFHLYSATISTHKHYN
nr:MAG TPA: hypothetical protein [Caudoviricetes sp.]